jgi:hypothetical protein
MPIKKNKSGQPPMSNAVAEKMHRRLGIVFYINPNVEPSFPQCHLKQFTFTGTVFDQKDERMSAHE